MRRMLPRSHCLFRFICQPYVPRCARAARPASVPEFKVHFRSQAWQANAYSIQRSTATELPAFDDVDDLDDTTKKALKQAGLIHMTQVQADTWQAALSGRDVVARAPTGTGKTLAFLLPSLQRILRVSPPANSISILILSPARELAQQIYTQSDLLTHLHPALASQALYGGVSKRRDRQNLERQIPAILTATPGRLKDHLESTQIHHRPFGEYFSHLQVLVLDEMDRLLDMGFQEDVQSILSFLPNERQTLLFSATIPTEVKSMIDACVRSDHIVVAGDRNHDGNNTPDKIQQSHLIVPPDKTVWSLIQLLLYLSKRPQHKILVFFPTTAQVAYFGRLLGEGLGHPAWQLHARLSQNLRTQTSNTFRHATQGLLLTTDVSARGLDYPNVTHVIQVGVPSDRDTYLHRLGRTGRAGQKGEAILLLSPAEQSFLDRDLAGWKVPQNDKLQRLVNEPLSLLLQDGQRRVNRQIRMGEFPQLEQDAITAYRSLFGFYSSRFRSLGVSSNDVLVQHVNSFATQTGLVELPTLSEKLAAQYGVKNHPALNVKSRWEPGETFDVGRPNKVNQKTSSSAVDFGWGIDTGPAKRRRARDWPTGKPGRSR